MLDAVREFTVGATPCPHPEELKRHALYVRDPDGPGPPMALCSACHTAMRDLLDRRAGRDEVEATLLALGYTTADAEKFWRDMQEGAAS